jgi:hypothetical protein
MKQIVAEGPNPRDVSPESTSVGTPNLLLVTVANVHQDSTVLVVEKNQPQTVSLPSNIFKTLQSLRHHSGLTDSECVRLCELIFQQKIRHTDLTKVVIKNRPLRDTPHFAQVEHGIRINTKLLRFGATSSMGPDKEKATKLNLYLGRWCTAGCPLKAQTDAVYRERG